MEIDKAFEVDWGKAGLKWSGRKVQKFLKEQLLAIIKELNENTPNIIPVDASCRDTMFQRSVPRLAEEPSAKSSTDEGVMTVVLDSFYNINSNPAPGIYLYDEETGEIYTEWADSYKFVSDGQQWIPGKFYRSGMLDLFYASYISVNSVAPSLTVESLIADLERLATKVSSLETSISRMPVVSDQMRTDHKIYGVVNGSYEDIAPEGKEVLIG